MKTRLLTGGAILLFLLLLLAVLLTFLGAYYKPPVVRMPKGIKGKLINAAGVTLRVVQKGEGPNVLLIHDCPGILEDWDGVMAELPASHRVAVYDRPGSGYSGGWEMNYNMNYDAEMAFCLMDSLKMHQAVIVGHSYGAGVALAMAMKDPVRVKAAVLAGVSPYEGEDPPFVVDLIGWGRFGIGLAETARYTWGPWAMRGIVRASFGPDRGAIPPGHLKERGGIFSDARNLVVMSRKLLNYDSEFHWMIPRYPKIQRPVFIVEGTKDPGVEQARRLHREIPDSRYLELEGAGPQVPVVRPAELARVIESAVKETTRP